MRPASIARFCRRALPQLFGATNGARIMRTVRAIVSSDRWQSFDRFHDTTKYLVKEYEAAGAGAEVYSVQTGGPAGSGRWIIREAADVRGATVDIIHPVRRRLLDYKANPLHVVGWSVSTPATGTTSDLVIVDTKEQAENMPEQGLAGKLVLTRLRPLALMRVLGDKGAAGVISDVPAPGFPNAVAWQRFGWGAIPLKDAATRLVGLVVSQRQGARLRELMKRHGRVTLRAKVHLRNYVGTHDVVSGIVRGRDDPQTEVWALAHSLEPGALDNASGVATCVEMARVIEELIAAGRLPRPRRSIRLLSSYKCYGFFHYLEHANRFDRPLAGVVIDSVGVRPEVTGRRLAWHATIPMSAQFVNGVGQTLLRSAMRLGNPGYRLTLAPFMSTADTLIGDPKYGFPCPWVETCYRRSGKIYNGYHSSADTVRLLSRRGLKMIAAAMAGYLYYLADAGSSEAMELAASETLRIEKCLHALRRSRNPDASAQAEHLRQQHRTSVAQLRRWLWGGDRAEILAHFARCEQRVSAAASALLGRKRPPPKRLPPAARRIPRRTAPLTPTMENALRDVAERIGQTKLPQWPLYWADGRRTLADIAEALCCEHKKEIALPQVTAFFEAHAELGYVKLIEPEDVISRARLVRDLRALGLRPGMTVMVHSSLSRIGHVRGGGETVVNALLAVLGRRGTLVVPSFNHGLAWVFNPLATRTTSGAIPDTLWRRPDAVRSNNATHAVAAVGPRAHEICDGDLETGPFSQDSPIGRIVHGGGFILALGVSHSSSTAYHVAEHSMPWRCADQCGLTGRVVTRGGEVRETGIYAWRQPACPVPVTMIDETLDRRKLQRRGKVGQADAALVKAIDLFRVRREHLKGRCATCASRPSYVNRLNY